MLNTRVIRTHAIHHDDRRPTRRRVLIVDDNIDAAESLALLLELQGHETYHVHDGIRAVEAARQLAPEFILLDIRMPLLDGIAAARRIRAMRLERRPFIVAVTSLGSAKDRVASDAAGIDAHLVKPVEWDVLEQLFKGDTQVATGTATSWTNQS